MSRSSREKEHLRTSQKVLDLCVQFLLTPNEETGMRAQVFCMKERGGEGEREAEGRREGRKKRQQHSNTENDLRGRSF